jgi:hypothetical protein
MLSDARRSTPEPRATIANTGGCRDGTLTRPRGLASAIVGNMGLTWGGSTGAVARAPRLRVRETRSPAPWLERRRQRLLDIGAEDHASHRAVEHERRNDARLPQPGDERRRASVVVRHGRD